MGCWAVHSCRVVDVGKRGGRANIDKYGTVRQDGVLTLLFNTACVQHPASDWVTGCPGHALRLMACNSTLGLAHEKRHIKFQRCLRSKPVEAYASPSTAAKRTPDRSVQMAVLLGVQGHPGPVLTFFCAAETLTKVLDLPVRRTGPARLATP